MGIKYETTGLRLHASTDGWAKTAYSPTPNKKLYKDVLAALDLTKLLLKFME